MQQMIDDISKMRKLSAQLPRRERQVAGFVLSDPDQVSFLTRGQIAEAAGVSVAAGHRVCVSIGFEGFRDIKIRLAQSVAVSLQYLDGNGAEESQTDQLVPQVFGALVDKLNAARHQLSTASLSEATRVHAGARRIVFFGVGGGSANVAREGANRFFRLGLPAGAHADGSFRRMLALTLTAGPSPSRRGASRRSCSIRSPSRASTAPARSA